MKKFIMLVIVILSTSCSTIVKYYTFGDITRKDYNGNVIETWEHATIEVSYSDSQTTGTFNPRGNNGVLNFYDADGKYHYIQGGIISIDNIQKIQYIGDYKQTNDKAEENKSFNEQQNEKNKLVQEYNKLCEEITYLKGELSRMENIGLKSYYKEIKTEIDELEVKKHNMGIDLKNNYGIEVNK